MKKFLLLLPLFFLTACQPSIPEVDVSQAECETIEEYRRMVGEEYRAKLEQISDTYWVARRAFQERLNECMYNAWEGNPCDEEWEARTEAYEAAMNDISNEAAYQTYKTALAAWDACHANFDQEQANYEAEARAKEAQCAEEANASIQQANEAREALTAEARAKMEADLAALDALEERCEEEERQRLEQLVQDAQEAARIQSDRVRGGSRRHIYRTGSPQCTGVIPGENTDPRTGKPEEVTVAEEVAEEVLTQLGESLTNTPIPTNIIDDKIFAIMVCAKLGTRINELEIEQADSIGSNRRRELELRDILARYRRAHRTWCSIAAGNTNGLQIQQDAEGLSQEDEPQCQADSDCGTPLCCSATEIGRWKCNEDGQCYTEREDCPEDHQCTGRPGQCTPNPRTIQCIFWNGHLIPVENVRTTTGQECDQDEHWHGPGVDVNGELVPDPAPNDCGYGKVGEVPVVDVLVPAEERRIEIRGGIFGN